MSDSELPEDDPGVKRLIDAIEALSEHFDSVHIVATVNDGGGNTDVISRGRGNWSARYGSLRETVLKMERAMTNREE
jgi:hypothetical protein